MDQPLMWYAVQHARYINQMLDDMESSGFSATQKATSGSWTDSDVAVFEEILKIREELKGNG